MEIISPKNYQIFQRESFNSGVWRLSGFCYEKVDAINVEIYGSSLKNEKIKHCFSVDTDKANSFFQHCNLPAGGWYDITISCIKNGNIICSKVRKFGIGEVFVVAGQSNSSNYGEERSSQESQMISSFHSNKWNIAKDPIEGAHDLSSGGSPWLSFGDNMYKYLNVPIGIAITGHGGTTVEQWSPNEMICGKSERKEGLFNWLLQRIQQLGLHGFRAVLWHQGESDVTNNTSTSEYFAKLKNIINTSRHRAGWYIPWFVAVTSYVNKENIRCNRIREAQKKIHLEKIAFSGPDTDLLSNDYRDLNGEGIHFSLKGLKKHGENWSEAVYKSSLFS